VGGRCFVVEALITQVLRIAHAGDYRGHQALYSLSLCLSTVLLSWHSSVVLWYKVACYIRCMYLTS
jgi:hypothetical protein